MRDAEPAIYFNFRQFPFRGLNVVVQGEGDPAALLAAVRTSVRLDPNPPIASARTLDRVIGEATDRPRALMLIGVFAAGTLAGDDWRLRRRSIRYRDCARIGTENLRT